MVGEQGVVQTAEQIEAMTVAQNKLTDALQNTVNPATMAGNVIDKLGKIAHDAGINIQNMSTLTPEMTSNLSLAANAVINLRVGFEGLAGVDTSGLVLIKDQMNYLTTALASGGTAAAAAKNTIRSLAEAQGIKGGAVEKILAGAAEGVISFAKNLVTGTDNMLKMQNAMYQLSAQGGDFGTKLGAVNYGGERLDNMNNMLTQQINKMKEAGDQTGLMASQIQQYWAQLGQVPGALQNLTVNLGKSNTSMNLLTATIDIAKATGYDQKEMYNDMAKSVNIYGSSVEGSIKFVSRMAEAANKTGIPLKNTREGIMSSVEAFKMFITSEGDAIKQSESLSKIMENYGGALKNAGLSSANSAALVTQMTTAVAGLRVEQLAFLSQQTGGPGGMQGAAKIQGMLERGETDKVAKLVEKQLKDQMGGKIVTREMAEKGGGAEQQWLKQSLLLQQGPLAQFAKSQAEADAILKAMSKGTSIFAETQSKNKNFGMDEQLSRGKAIGDLSKSPVSDLKSTLEGLEYTVNIKNFETMKNAFSGLTGSRTADTVEMSAYRENLIKRGPVSANNVTPESMMTGVAKEGANVIKNSASHLMSQAGIFAGHIISTGSKQKDAQASDREDYQKKLEAEQNRFNKLSQIKDKNDQPVRSAEFIKSWNNLNAMKSQEDSMQSNNTPPNVAPGKQVGAAARRSTASMAESAAAVTNDTTPGMAAGGTFRIEPLLVTIQDENGKKLSDAALEVAPVNKGQR